MEAHGYYIYLTHFNNRFLIEVYSNEHLSKLADKQNEYIVDILVCILRQFYNVDSMLIQKNK